MTIKISDAGILFNDQTTLNSAYNLGPRNKIINGGMQVGQRGSTVISTTTNVYGWVDRWLLSISGTTVSALGYQAMGQATTTGYALQIGNVTTTGATTLAASQRIESLNSYGLNGKTITISGKVQQTSGATQTLTLSLNKANAVDNFGAQTLIQSTTVSVPTATWTPFTWTITLGSTDASNGIQFGMAYNSLTAQSNTQWYFGDVQLEVGSTATPFEQRDYGDVLRQCQRYFSSSAATGKFVANAPPTYTHVQLKVSMRSTPAVTPSGVTPTDLNTGTEGFYFLAPSLTSFNWTASAEL